MSVFFSVSFGIVCCVVLYMFHCVPVACPAEPSCCNECVADMCTKKERAELSVLSLSDIVCG